MLLAPGPVTVVRFGGLKGDKMLVFEGEVVDTPMAFKGAYGDVKLPADQSVKELVSRIMEMGCEHHYSLTYTHHADILAEMGYWLGCK